MSPKRVRDLLDRIGSLRHPCDLDLLLFFYRHPRTVLSSERLAMYVGYDLSEVAKSLETLIAAELLTRLQRPPRSARMYLLTSEPPLGGWIEALLRLASTREGRLRVLAALAERQALEQSPTTGEPDRPVAQRSPQRRLSAPPTMEVGHA
jgi:hypothetical protein